MAEGHREDEKQRREAAQASTAAVEPGGSAVPGRAIKQMVSVRLEAQLLKGLRILAAERGVSISDLLREAAEDLVEESRPATVRMTYHSVGNQQAVVGNMMTGRLATYGVTTIGEPGQWPVSGSQEYIKVLP